MMSDRLDAAELEEGTRFKLDFGKLRAIAQGGTDVLPVAIQDVATGEVLMIGYVDEEALNLTRAGGTVVLWSTSRGERWHTGASSGDTLAVDEIRVNCEQNSLLFLVRMQGAGVCHTRGPGGHTRPTCYYRRLTADGLEPASSRSPPRRS